MIKAAVLGATGYAGIELVRLLTSHPEVSIEILGSHSFAGQKISDVYKNFNHVLEKECEELDLDKVGACDVAFTALPHGASKSVIPSLLEKGLKVIDLSGDYRYDDVAVYEKWYGEKHSSPELLKESVYGLPELHRDKIKNARLIGNPGCYTTCSILGTVPLLANKIAETKNIIVDAKSGVTGAGRGRGSPGCGPGSSTACRCSRRCASRRSSWTGRCCRTAGRPRSACRPRLP